MARARNIKPGFFTNDELAQCEYGARLVFAGLWCVADRDGRLEDRPLRIKAQIMPFDSCDINEWLNQLASRGFITRYEIGGRKYIQITNFRKHQNPHVNEASSTIPSPEQHHSTPADSLLPITDSLLPHTDTLTRTSGAKRAKFVAPTIDQVRDYCEARGNKVDAQLFLDHYTANGWVQGRGKPLKDWQAAVRTWERNGVSAVAAAKPAREPLRMPTPEELAAHNPAGGPT